MSSSDASFVLLISLLVIGLVLLTPFLSIWAVNTLFGTSIPFNLATWCASLILSGVVSGGGVSFRK